MASLEKQKGISPLVAAVLLIAVTMTIAGVLAYWAASFVQTSLPAANQTEADCRLAEFSIYSCRYSNSSSTINLILENKKNIELRGLKVFLFYANDTISDPISLDGALPPGGMLKSFIINNVDWNFTKISVGTHCPELTKEKVCTKV